MKRSILLWLPILALAGCGHQESLHSVKYYETHKEALKTENVACRPIIRYLQEHRAAAKKVNSCFEKTQTNKDHKVCNCVFALRAQGAEEMAGVIAGIGAGTNSTMP